MKDIITVKVDGYCNTCLDSHPDDDVIDTCGCRESGAFLINGRGGWGGYQRVLSEDGREEQTKVNFLGMEFYANNFDHMVEELERRFALFENVEIRVEF